MKPPNQGEKAEDFVDRLVREVKEVIEMDVKGAVDMLLEFLEDHEYDAAIRDTILDDILIYKICREIGISDEEVEECDALWQQIVDTLSFSIDVKISYELDERSLREILRTAIRKRGAKEDGDPRSKNRFTF